MHKILSNLLCVALTIIVVFKFILKDIPNYVYFDGEVKDVAVNISLSYIAAYIFYFIQVYLPERNKRIRFLTSIKKPVTDIKSHIESIFLIFEINIDKINNDIDFENEIQALSKINMLGDSKGVDIVRGKMKKWSKIEDIELTRQDISECAEHCQNIYTLDIKLNKLLYDVKVCRLFKFNYPHYRIVANGTKILSCNGDVYAKSVKEFYIIYLRVKSFIDDIDTELATYNYMIEEK